MRRCPIKLRQAPRSPIQMQTKLQIIKIRPASTQINKITPIPNLLPFAEAVPKDKKRRKRHLPTTTGLAYNRNLNQCGYNL